MTMRQRTRPMDDELSSEAAMVPQPPSSNTIDQGTERAGRNIPDDDQPVSESPDSPVARAEPHHTGKGDASGSSPAEVGGGSASPADPDYLCRSTAYVPVVQWPDGMEASEKDVPSASGRHREAMFVGTPPSCPVCGKQAALPADWDEVLFYKAYVWSDDDWDAFEQADPETRERLRADHQARFEAVVDLVSVELSCFGRTAWKAVFATEWLPDPEDTPSPTHFDA
jgi:hypothetical protein